MQKRAQNGPNCKTKNIKPFEGSTGQRRHDTGLGNEFLDVAPKTDNEGQKCQIGSHENPNILCMKRHFYGVQKQPIGWEKIFASPITEKGLIPEYIKSS